MEHISRNAAFELLKKYNKDPFHIQHALTVEAVMKWYANELGYGDDAQYWGIVGLLHDIDFELYPDQHCIKAPELLREGGVSEDIIHGVVSHGYGITVDVAPEHEMEKVLFAADELTGLIWAAALMRPSKSTKDMELKSLKKKYKSKGFAAGCSREVIERGAQQLGWELEKLLTMTLAAMAASEDTINEVSLPFTVDMTTTMGELMSHPKTAGKMMEYLEGISQGEESKKEEGEVELVTPEIIAQMPLKSFLSVIPGEAIEQMIVELNSLCAEEGK